MDFIAGIVDAVNDVVWGWPMLILLVGTHLFLTFRLRFIQSHVFKGIKLTFTKDEEASGDVSQWGALATALSATLGTGNIIGVGTAIRRGGPGSVFWLWVTGLFGIATKYGEAVVAIKYRVKTSDGSMLGGPMYAAERGMNAKWLGILFALFGAIACFGIGNLVQVNGVAANLEDTFGVPPMATGIAVAILTLVVIVGGIKSISKVAEKVIPFMSVLYVAGCIIILGINAGYIVPAFIMIMRAAFSTQAFFGGVAGYTVERAMRFGIARGLFSNEAGLGSAPIAAAAAITRNPVRQGLVSMSQVFWDTIIICAIGGLMFVTSVMKRTGDFINADDAIISGALFARTAFQDLGTIGPYIVTIAIVLFAWTTVLGWGYYGERCIEYLFGKKALMPFRIVYGAMTFVGAVIALDLVWDIADMFNAFMAIPNLITLIALSGVIVKVTKDYLWDKNLDAVDPEPIMELN